MADSIETSDREAEDPREPIRLPVREMRDEPEPQRAAQEGDLPPLPEPKAWMDDEGRVVSFNLVKRYPEHRIGYNTSLHTADQMREYARLALAAAGGGVPQGWKLVPVEPTPEMLQAAIQLEADTINEWDDEPNHSEIYRAMLASSPQPEAAPAVAQVPTEWREAVDAAREAMRAVRINMKNNAPHLSGKSWGYLDQALERLDVLAAAPEAPAQAAQWNPPPLTCPRSNRSDCALFGASIRVNSAKGSDHG